jgi:hypothetical protein
MAFEILRDMLILTSGAFLFDWFGYASLKNIARSFRPLNDDFSYGSTLLPRSLCFPVVAVLLICGKYADSYSLLLGSAGLVLWIFVHGVLWARVMQERLRNRP